MITKGYLSKVRPVSLEAFYSKLEGNIMCDEYDKFVQDVSKQGCKMTMDWLKVYNNVNVIPFVKAIDKTCQHYYPDEITMLQDAVSIPGISMMYVLNKSLKMKTTGEPELFALGQPCFYKCEDCEVDPKHGCHKCKNLWND